MKKTLSIQAIIIIIASIIALAITLFVGGLAKGASLFYWNTLLINITFIGDGLFSLGLFFFLLLFFKQKKMAKEFLITTLFTIVLVQFIKNFCSNQPFQFYFESGIVSPETQNIFYHNFISSHTALAFTLAIFFSFQIKKIQYRIVFFIVAFLVTYTRVIIAQESIVAVLLGILPVFGSYLILKKMNSGYFSNKHYFFKENTNREISVQ